MSEQRLKGKRVLVTQAADYMGPATVELFAEHGAEVIADESDLTQPGAAQEIIDAAGRKPGSRRQIWGHGARNG